MSITVLYMQEQNQLQDVWREMDESLGFVYLLYFIFETDNQILNYSLQSLPSNSQKMQWIDNYQLRPKPISRKYLLQKFRNLSLDQSQQIQPDYPKQYRLQSFQEHSFFASLQRQFKQYSLTFQNQEHEQDLQSDSQIYCDFSLLLPTQYESINIVINVEMNKRLEYVKYRSYPVKNYTIFSFPADQINTISKYLSFNFNPKNPLGCMSIDVVSGELVYQAVNNSLGHLFRRLKKAPNELIYFIDWEIKEIERIWKSFLPNLFRNLSIKATRNKSHAFWKNPKEKKNLYESDQFNILTQYIKQSYIEHPFMFEQLEQSNGVKGIKKIRFKFLSTDEKKKKKSDYNKMISNKHYYEYKLVRDIVNILSVYVSGNLLDYQSRRRRFQIPQQKKEELSSHLVIENFESRHLLYSELSVRSVMRDQELTRSGFSNLHLLHMVAKKIEDADFGMNLIVSKETQTSRYINETEILKAIGNGKCLFITRFFFPKQESNLNNKILLQYCPQKSIDTYLAVNKHFISLETKLFFMYEIAVGLRFLRDYGIIHNDLKPQNVLMKIMSDRLKISSTFMLRLIDFGESCLSVNGHLNQTNTYRRGFTIPYASPQQTKYNQYTEKNDIFSFGVMLWEIIFDSFPLEIARKGKEIYSTDEYYLRFYSIAPEKCKYYSLPKTIQIVYQLCLRCLSPNYVHRPTIDWVVATLREVLLFGDKVYTL